MFTTREKARCVLLFSEYKSVTQTRRRFRLIFEKAPPSRNSILHWVRQFSQEGTVKRKVRTDPNAQNNLLDDILLVREVLFLNNNQISIRKIAQMINMSKSKVHKILKIIKFKAYKIQTFQKIENHALEKRYFMCETLLDLFRNEPDTNLIMSDEASFHLSGRVNKHNCRIWGDENPRAYNEFERDSPKLNVWCAVSKSEIYGPFFFSRSNSEWKQLHRYVGNIFLSSTSAGRNFRYGLFSARRCTTTLLQGRKGFLRYYFWKQMDRASRSNRVGTLFSRSNHSRFLYMGICKGTLLQSNPKKSG